MASESSTLPAEQFSSDVSARAPPKSRKPWVNTEKRQAAFQKCRAAREKKLAEKRSLAVVAPIVSQPQGEAKKQAQRIVAAMKSSSVVNSQVV